MYVMFTIIDQKIIEFELLVFELCPFFAKVPQNKICIQVLTATVSVSLIHCKCHLNTLPTELTDQNNM